VCLATDGAVNIKGGNWQIFSRMAYAGTPDIYLNTPIGGISTDSIGTFRLQGTAQTKAAAEALDSGFDEIIIATPLQFAELILDPEPEKLPDEIPYVQLHVTLLASPHLLAPAAFNLPADGQVPLVVLTTLHPSESPGSKPSYAGKAGFFSISMLQPVLNPSTGGQEYLYKIFAPHPITAEFLARILGIEEPKSIDDFDKKDISWLYKKIWHSYPVEFPRVTFEKLQLAPRLWYTAGIESFISTMETSALAGSNVAKLIVNGWQSSKPEVPEGSEGPEAFVQPVDNAQQILKAKL
jgi:prenylcysteine oxidase/farnesylcysteine lyase